MIMFACYFTHLITFPKTVTAVGSSGVMKQLTKSHVEFFQTKIITVDENREPGRNWINWPKNGRVNRCAIVNETIFVRLPVK